MELYMLIAIALLLALAVIAVVVHNRKLHLRVRYFERRFAGVLDIDREVEAVAKQKRQLEASVNALRVSYQEKKAIFDKLTKEAAIYDEEIQLAELGFYKPHFDFDTSEEYKEQIAAARDAQKQQLSKKTAIFCRTDWAVDGSKTKGRAMTNRGIRLTARAFNNECDAAVSNVSWNNAQRMEERIRKTFDAINKLNESTAIEIDPAYRDLKLEELQLTHEYRLKRQEEREEQAEIRRRMREEAKLQQEAEKALSEEQKFVQLLEKAQQEATSATADRLGALQAKIAALSNELESAHARSERAISMAQQTKSGHIYIISNVGSFGEDVYKIGMTRRLDPTDRVKELGDASVPFVFDIHAMIYADDAPAVENALHKNFEAKRVNLVNSRKEFFQVSLDEIRDEVLKSFPDAEFIELQEAQEYRETLALREQLAHARAVATEQYPVAI